MTQIMVSFFVFFVCFFVCLRMCLFSEKALTKSNCFSIIQQSLLCSYHNLFFRIILLQSITLTSFYHKNMTLLRGAHLCFPVESHTNLTTLQIVGLCMVSRDLATGCSNTQIPTYAERHLVFLLLPSSHWPSHVLVS